MKKYVMKCDYTNHFGVKVKKGQSVYKKDFGMFDKTGARIFQYDSPAYNSYVKETGTDAEKINIELIINDEETIAIVRDENGKFKKGVAKPYYQDEYNKNTGIIIAIQKALGVYKDVEDFEKVEDKTNNDVYIDIDWEDFQTGGIFIKFNNQNEVGVFLKYILENDVINIENDDFEGISIEERIKSWKRANLQSGEDLIGYSSHGGKYLVTRYYKNTISSRKMLLFSSILKVNKATTLLDNATNEELISELSKRMESDV